MTSKFARFLLLTVFVASVTALAQTDSAAAALAPAPKATTPGAMTPGGTRIGTINIEQAVFGSNEGQRDIEALSKKLEPKQTELKGTNDELENLKKQLNTQGDKLNDETRSTLVKQIEQKQKSFERSVQDARDDAQNQQNEIFQRILQKMGPLVLKYAGENGFGLIIDTSNPWPQGPVVWAAASVDITKPIVDAYNTQSGVPAPKPAAGAKPGASATKPAVTVPPGAKPAATPPPAPKPQTPPPK
jgi:outer membrane protein